MTAIPTSGAEQGEAGEAVRCWRCGAVHPPVVFCPACDAIQALPDEADYFHVLGIPRRLTLDPADLQKRYYQLQRRLHPDLHQTGPLAAREASLRNSAAVNRAYQTLSDPIDRGLYWLTLEGQSLAANNNRVPPELADLVFEVQEHLDTVRLARGGSAAGALLRELQGVRAELEARRRTLQQRLGANFGRWDGGDGGHATLTGELKEILSALAYVGTLLRDVDRELEA